MERCPWCLGNEKMIRYHDEECVPAHNDPKRLEFLMMGNFPIVCAMYFTVIVSFALNLLTKTALLFTSKAVLPNDIML